MKIDTINFWMSSIFRILLLTASVLSFFKGHYQTFALSLIAIFISFMPSIIEKKYKIEIPDKLEFLILFLIYGSLYLGEIRHFYYKIWWWDLLLHSISGVIIGALGFMLVYILNKEKGLTLNPFFVSLFAFSFSLSLGVIWEFFEFAMDYYFGLNMQKSGLVDTMTDLMLDALGALLISVYGYFKSFYLSL